MTFIDYGVIQSIRDRLRDYEMRVIHADGAYRHLRFHSTTDPFPGNCSFDVITWPGHAWIGGDWCGGHTIAREPDMLTEFLNVDHISYDYWAEKMRMASRVTTTLPSTRTYEAWVQQTAQELASEYTLTESDTEEIIDAYMKLVNLEHPNVVDWCDLESIEPLEFDTGYDVVEVPLAISDAWQLEFIEYARGFLVACEGLRFAAKQWEKRHFRPQGEVPSWLTSGLQKQLAAMGIPLNSVDNEDGVEFASVMLDNEEADNPIAQVFDENANYVDDGDLLVPGELYAEDEVVGARFVTPWFPYKREDQEQQ